jgi:hypothetical protein
MARFLTTVDESLRVVVHVTSFLTEFSVLERVVDARFVAIVNVTIAAGDDFMRISISRRSTQRILGHKLFEFALLLSVQRTELGSSVMSNLS